MPCTQFSLSFTPDVSVIFTINEPILIDFSIVNLEMVNFFYLSTALNFFLVFCFCLFEMMQ